MLVAVGVAVSVGVIDGVSVIDGVNVIEGVHVIEGVRVGTGVDVIDGVALGNGVAVNVLVGGKVGSSVKVTAVTECRVDNVGVSDAGIDVCGVGVNENVAPGDVFTNCAVIKSVGSLAAPGELAVAGGVPCGALRVTDVAPLMVNVW